MKDSDLCTCGHSAVLHFSLTPRRCCAGSVWDPSPTFRCDCQEFTA